MMNTTKEARLLSDGSDVYVQNDNGKRCELYGDILPESMPKVIEPSGVGFATFDSLRTKTAHKGLTLNYVNNNL